MKAVVYKGARKVAVEEVDDPKIEHPRDAIVRMTSSAICGSDLHMYEGRTTAKPGKIFGHEPIGVVEKVGDSVVSIKEGDRVVMTFNIACGYCFNCVRGFTSACLTANAKQPGGAFGYANLGPYAGAQAEYLRVPFADFNCIKLPGTPGDKWEDDFVLLADIFPTALFANELAMVMPGVDVAVFGAGPVGLLSAYSAILKGAGQVYVVDYIPERLKKAEQIGAIPIDFTKGDPVDQIKTIKASNPANMGKLLPGEEKLSGVMCGIDAVGYQARDRKDPRTENPTQVIDDLVRLVNATGHLGIIGVYMAEDPGAATEDAKQGRFMMPWGKIWHNGLSIGTGQTPVKRHAIMLRELVIAEKVKPSFIVSHRIPIEDTPDAYKQFDERYDGYTKVVIKFGK
ncbi:MAG: glutathione-independent formaldehyde dehydrogenase [Methanotrichaceae archaeon]